MIVKYNTNLYSAVSNWKPPKLPRILRKCLNCRDDFYSNGDRLCKKCKHAQKAFGFKEYSLSL